MLGAGADNPFSILSFIIAPAILTNACAIMVMSTSVRLARMIDRMRNLRGRCQETQGMTATAEAQLSAVGADALRLARGITSFYVGAGSFAATTLACTLGAVSSSLGLPSLATGTCTALALLFGPVGVAALVTGLMLLVRAMWTELRALREEVATAAHSGRLSR